MKIPKNEEDLLKLVADKVEESLSLDYKRADALTSNRGDLTKEVTKDVSAFANAAGGIIIYGMAEGSGDTKHLPIALSPINRSFFSKERLEHLINNIQPRIAGIEIVPISLSSGNEDVAYVVVVPTSTTAHQCTDKRYYRRHNFEAVMMEDYEIRDIMNRQVHPSVEAHVRLTHMNGSPMFQIRVSNAGRILAKHYVVKVFVPFNVGGTSFLAAEQVDFQTTQDRYWQASFPKILDVCRPLFPGEEIFKNIAIHMEPHYGKSAPEPSKFKEIICTVYADNMPFKEKRIEANSLDESFQ